MKILVLGGTRFLGRHVVEEALAAGHELTLFNRGQSNPDLYPEVEQIRGDRTQGLEGLEGRRWDLVVDPSGYVPRHVRASAEFLADKVDHYVFISSMSVYGEAQEPGDESTPLATLEDESVEEITGETYGGLKVLCERAVDAAFPGRALHVRAGLIVGPYDPINRFPYWIERIPRGGEVLAPGQPDAAVQLIDGRDIATWIFHAVSQGISGAFNVTGPEQPLPFGTVLETIRAESGSDATLVWVDDEFLVSQGIAPLDEIPLWVPPEMRWFLNRRVDRAIEAGLTFRPLAETVRDTLAWIPSRPAPRSNPLMRGAITPEREAELLAAWHSAQAR